MTNHVRLPICGQVETRVAGELFVCIKSWIPRGSLGLRNSAPPPPKKSRKLWRYEGIFRRIALFTRLLCHCEFRLPAFVTEFLKREEVVNGHDAYRFFSRLNCTGAKKCPRPTRSR